MISHTLELVRATKYCLRRTRRQPFLSGALLLVIATATTLASAVFAIADAGWRRPFAYPASDELYVVSLVDPATRRERRTVPLDVGRRWPQLDDVRTGRYEIRPQHVDLPSGARYVVSVAASRALLDLLRVQPRLGRFFGPEESGAVVIGERLWRTEFDGDAGVIGRPLVVDDVPRTIVGVAPADFVVPGFPGAGAVLSSLEPEATSADGASNVLARSRLPASAIASRLNDSAGFDARVGDAGPRRPVVAVTALAKAALPNLAAVPLFVVLMVSFLGLTWLIGGHLLAAAAVSWARDLRIKLSLGASRVSALVEIVVPALLPIVAGSFLGLIAGSGLLSSFGVDIRHGLGLSRNPEMDATIRGVIVSINAVMAAGFLAVLWTIHMRPAVNDLAVARRESAGGVRGSRFRRALLATQMTFAAVTLILAAATASMLALALNADLGLDPADVVATEVWLNGAADPVAAKVTFAEIEDRLTAIPGAQSVSLVDLLPFSGAIPGREPVTVAGRGETRATIARVGAGYFETLRIPIVSGRTLTRADLTFPPTVAIVDRLFAGEHWPRNSPLGQRLVVGGRSLEIVGTVGATMPVRLNRPSEPTIYVPYSDESYRRYAGARGILVRAAPGQAGRVRPAVDDVLAGLGARAQVQPAKMLERMVGDGALAPRFYASLTGLFGWCALLLASIGIYSVVAVTMRARASEIAIRTICGATRARIVRETLRFSMLPVAVGLVVGIGPGLLAARLLSTQLRIDAGQDIWAIGIASTCLVAAAAMATVVPAMRQAATDPARLLRDSGTTADW